MLDSKNPTDVVFFDREQVRKRHIRMYTNVTLEIIDGVVDSVITLNPMEYAKYRYLLGKKVSDITE